MQIEFNRVDLVSNERTYINQALDSGRLCGGGPFEMACVEWFSKHLEIRSALMTPSCTHALEMMAILLDIREGDEVIMPSYTFVSTANAFVLHGATIVFVDIRADTCNIDEKLIEDAITDKTKAIVVVHYAGVACEMDSIMEIASRYSLHVLEDAAQAIMSKYKGRQLGTIGSLGAFSFHETKNITSGGGGGALLINDSRLLERAEIIREKGTNRKKFIEGQIDKYSWVDIGSSYLSTELQNAFLLAQLESSTKITQKRVRLWNDYYEGLRLLEENGLLKLPKIPNGCEGNAHIFFILLNSIDARSALIQYLKAKGISTTFHYVPLHSSEFGRRAGRFSGEDNVTSSTSELLLRLPMFYSLESREVNEICFHINSFFSAIQLKI